MKDRLLARADVNDLNDLNDLARVRILLLDALAVLDRNPTSPAIIVAAYVSHALEVLSPGADPFELAEPGCGDPPI